jgi:RNA polymerase subunit RPABC4/transcription elongation factor Spt4
MVERCPTCGSYLVTNHGMWLRQFEVVFVRICRQCGKVWERKEERGPKLTRR